MGRGCFASSFFFFSFFLSLPGLPCVVRGSRLMEGFRTHSDTAGVDLGLRIGVFQAACS